MLRVRVIPTLLLRNKSLVKTVKFGKFRYVGDPVNTVRIFNELEVDELFFLDITASSQRYEPNLEVLTNIANECFMPLGYGGGIRSLDNVKSIFDIGFEKVAVNTGSVDMPSLIPDIANLYGSQAVIASIDVKTDFFGKKTVRTFSGKSNSRLKPVEWAKEVERMGAGEILLTSINREGTWQGFELDLVKSITDAVDIPVVAHGGAGRLEDISTVVKNAGASAVALGSMVVFQKKGMGVLINFPNKSQLKNILK